MIKTVFDGSVANRGAEPPGGDVPSREAFQGISRGDLQVRVAGGYRKEVVDGFEVRNPKIDVAWTNPEGRSVVDGVLVSSGAWRDHTFLVGLREILPEDLLWRAERPRIPTLVCLQDDHGCDCPWGCVMKLGTRIAWLFDRHPDLEQVLVLFKRDEGDLWRKLPAGIGYTEREEAAGIRSPKVQVPRYWVLAVPVGFQRMARPYRLFRANYDGLNHILRGTAPRRIQTSVDFWL